MGRGLPLLVALLLGSLGAGLGAPPKPAGAPPKPSGLPKLGIVSAIGDKFYVSKFGLGVFGNEVSEMAIAAWGIDEMDRKSTRLNSSHIPLSRMPSSA